MLAFAPRDQPASAVRQRHHKMSYLRGSFTFRKYLREQAVATRHFRGPRAFCLSLQMQTLDFRRMMLTVGERIAIYLEGEQQ